VAVDVVGSDVAGCSVTSAVSANEAVICRAVGTGVVAG
jgi:hypothetical protein